MSRPRTKCVVCDARLAPRRRQARGPTVGGASSREFVLDERVRRDDDLPRGNLVTALIEFENSRSPEALGRSVSASNPPPKRGSLALGGDGAGKGDRALMDRNATAAETAPARRRLVEDGYCRIPGGLDSGILRSVQEMAATALAAVDAEHRARWRSQGSLVPLADHPPFAALIAHPGLQEMFSRMGFDDTRFTSGYVISKPPGGPALFWHQDWWGWRHPISRTDRIAQIALFLYLTDTRRENGCLRVIPGSHRRPHPLHDVIDAHDPALASVENPDDPAYAPHPDQVDVPVTAGDVVVADARLVHGAHPNRSDRERTNITLWWHPGYSELPPGIRARLWSIVRREEVDTDPAAGRALHPHRWPEPWRSLVLPVMADDPGPVAPEPWVRQPRFG